MQTKTVDGTLEEFKMYIDGKWVDASSGKKLTSLNPYTQREWAVVPDASSDDVSAAIAAARQAFDEGPWASTTPQQRAAMMRKLAELIARDAEKLARIESTDNGKLLREMVAQWKYIPEWFYYYAGLATQAQGEVLPSDKPNFFAFTRKEPVGVVAAVTPWNSPGLLIGSGNSRRCWPRAALSWSSHLNTRRCPRWSSPSWSKKPEFRLACSMC